MIEPALFMDPRKESLQVFPIESYKSMMIGLIQETSLSVSPGAGVGLNSLSFFLFTSQLIRRTSIGSTFEARWAGRKAAMVDIKSSNKMTSPAVMGSVGGTP